MADSDKKPYKVLFNWSKPDSGKGKLVAVSCDEENIPSESGRAYIGNLFVSTGKYTQEACLTINKANKLQFSKGSFLYMDVGCWLGGNQSFGLVCGDDAFVCDYGSNRGKAAGKTGNPLLDDFMRLPGVSILFREKIPSPHPMDPKQMYLILPDMHVPEAPPKNKRPPESDEWDSLHYGAWDLDPRTFDTMSKRDLFDSRDSIGAMVQFLGMVQGSDSAKQITLVQLGDMYELWAKRDCYFVQTTVPEIILKSGSVKEIGEWIGGTHQFYPELFQAFDQCKSKGMPLLFLYGNHDNYLSHPEVVAAANTYITTEAQHYVETARTSWNGKKERVCEPSVVYPRLKEISQDNLFIEHGQRCDHYNRDGETEGHDKTQTAADHPSLRAYGPVFRTIFVVGAAAHWCVEQKNFGLYVMGHTHEADLRRVEVYHRLEEINYVVGPEGMDIVKTETPLEGVSQ